MIYCCFFLSQYINVIVNSPLKCNEFAHENPVTMLIQDFMERPSNRFLFSPKPLNQLVHIEIEMFILFYSDLSHKLRTKIMHTGEVVERPPLIC